VYLSSSNFVIVKNCSLVMFYKISYKLRFPIVVVDYKTAQMKFENSN
jgi:hypothetical protein